MSISRLVPSLSSVGLDDGTKNEDHREELGLEVRALVPRSIETLREIKPENVDPSAHVSRRADITPSKPGSDGRFGRLPGG